MDTVRINVDAVCLRAFCTYVCRRHDGSLRRVSLFMLEKVFIRAVVFISFCGCMHGCNCEELPLRALFEEVGKYWAPKPKSRRAGTASSEALSGDGEAESQAAEAEAEPKEDVPLDDEDENVAVVQDLYEAGDEEMMEIEQELRAALVDVAPEPVEPPSLKSGLTHEMEALQISTPAKSAEQASMSGAAIIEIGDSPTPLKLKPAVRFDMPGERAVRLERLKFLQ